MSIICVNAVRLNPVLCASEWPPLLPEYGPACEPDSDDDGLPELEVRTKYEYCDREGHYYGWQDASHLLCNSMIGPSGHLQGCGAGCAHASDDWSDAESVDYGDSEDECDQWNDQEEWQDATHLLKSSR